MSTRLLARVWEHSPARGESLLLHLTLADEAGRNGEVVLDLERLAHRTRMSVDDVEVTLGVMEGHGLLRKLADGRYQVLVEWIE
jgi:hypothetical protein